VLLESKAMTDGRRRDSVMSVDDDGDKQQGLDGAAGALSQSFASGSMTELSSLYSMSEDVSPCCLTCGQKTCTHPNVFLYSRLCAFLTEQHKLTSGQSDLTKAASNLWWKAGAQSNLEWRVGVPLILTLRPV